MARLRTLGVYAGESEGYPVYRIPSLITSQNGTVLAFCEGRAGRNDHSENDIVLKTSQDGGESWSPVRAIASDGHNCLNNPQAVVSQDTGRIFLMYQHSPYGYHAERRENWYGKVLQAVDRGYEGEHIRRCFLISSDDEGVSWSEPREVTRGVKYQDAISLASGPGIGIQITAGEYTGRLLMPFNHRSSESGKQVYTAYSDDGGETWTKGNPAPDGAPGFANEVQVVELTGGRVMLNARSGTGCRKTGISEDGGESWTPLQDNSDLVDPVCQASILRCNEAGKDGVAFLFSNPASAGDRVNGTVRLSRDEGMSWPVTKIICPGRFAYSCLASLPNGKIGCLYETGVERSYETIKLAVFSLRWLTG